MKAEINVESQDNNDIGAVLARLMEFATIVGLAFAILVIVRTLFSFANAGEADA